MKILIKPQIMNEKIMNELEERGLIVRLIPSRDIHRLHVNKDEGKGDYLYKSDINYGSHSLVNCAIDNELFYSFGTHPDNEEFLLLGGINEKKMFLLISLISKEELDIKIKLNSLSDKDFVCLECVFNDPNLSFFVMNKEVPHGECSKGFGRPTTFYVTEGSQLPLIRTKFNDYQIDIDFE